MKASKSAVLTAFLNQSSARTGQNRILVLILHVTFTLHLFLSHYIRFGIQYYPTILVINDAHSMRQEAHGNKDLSSIVPWVRDVATEWRFLFEHANLTRISSLQHFKTHVIDSADFHVVVFSDGLHCRCVAATKQQAARHVMALTRNAQSLQDSSVQRSASVIRSPSRAAAPHSPRLHRRLRTGSAL